jgi:hypothetical protein
MGGTQSDESKSSRAILETTDINQNVITIDYQEFYENELKENLANKVLSKRAKKRLERLNCGTKQEEKDEWVLLGAERDLSRGLKPDPLGSEANPTGDNENANIKEEDILSDDGTGVGGLSELKRTQKTSSHNENLKRNRNHVLKHPQFHNKKLKSIKTFVIQQPK